MLRSQVEVGGITDFANLVAALILGVILVSDEGSKRIFWKFSNWVVCPNIADLVQKVRFTAIIHYFGLDITSYRLFGIDNYKIKTSQTLNDQKML